MSTLIGCSLLGDYNGYYPQYQVTSDLVVPIPAIKSMARGYCNTAPPRKGQPAKQ